MTATNPQPSPALDSELERVAVLSALILGYRDAFKELRKHPQTDDDTIYLFLLATIEAKARDAIFERQNLLAKLIHGRFTMPEEPPK